VTLAAYSHPCLLVIEVLSTPSLVVNVTSRLVAYLAEVMKHEIFFSLLGVFV
jgi:hypothetical protein